MWKEIASISIKLEGKRRENSPDHVYDAIFIVITDSFFTFGGI
jgi:hypothetical protein